MTLSHFIASTADVSPDAAVSEGTQIWHLAQVREHARIGQGCTIGRGAYIGIGVEVGANSKIQNYALVYAPARLGHGVFVGPGAVLTNDRYPRAIRPDGSPKDRGDWDPMGVSVEEGATIGAQATIVAGVDVGAWSVVGAGSVVTADVRPFSLVFGNPARHVAWVGRSGRRLESQRGFLVDPSNGDRFREVDSRLEELS